MLGLMVFGALFLYLIVSIVVVVVAVNWADKHGKSPGISGVVAAVFMYSLVFWDLIPVHAVYNYQCKTNAGFTIYKGLEQWKQENPSVAETLTPIKNAKWQHEGHVTRVPLNQRFIWQTTREKIWHIILKKNEQIIDVKTDDVLAEYIDVYTDLTPLALGGSDKGWANLKFWLQIKSCPRGEDKSKWLVESDSIRSFRDKFQYINGDKK